ncbi:MAG: hypothetical protein DMF25_01330 [Verrucomicrobia bacterium]|nr:MAG: hypothetical protein DMF25_01330 [Verrucomicrobiota bacterium]
MRQRQAIESISWIAPLLLFVLECRSPVATVEGAVRRRQVWRQVLYKSGCPLHKFTQNFVATARKLDY